VCNYLIQLIQYRRPRTSLPTPFISAQLLSERTVVSTRILNPQAAILKKQTKNLLYLADNTASVKINISAQRVHMYYYYYYLVVTRW
jgi:hypothetical protein